MWSKMVCMTSLVEGLFSSVSVVTHIYRNLTANFKVEGSSQSQSIREALRPCHGFIKMLSFIESLGSLQAHYEYSNFQLLMRRPYILPLSHSFFFFDTCLCLCMIQLKVKRFVIICYMFQQLNQKTNSSSRLSVLSSRITSSLSINFIVKHYTYNFNNKKKMLLTSYGFRRS